MPKWVFSLPCPGPHPRIFPKDRAPIGLRAQNWAQSLPFNLGGKNSFGLNPPLAPKVQRELKKLSFPLPAAKPLGLGRLLVWNWPKTRKGQGPALEWPLMQPTLPGLKYPANRTRANTPRPDPGQVIGFLGGRPETQVGAARRKILLCVSSGCELPAR